MIDLHTPGMTEAFAVAPVFAKKAVVTIVAVEPGTVIVTTLADGTRETANTATADQCWVVTNPGGERHLIATEKMEARYVPLGNDLYRARGAVRAFRNPTGADVTVAAPWGEQHGGPRCMFAVAVTPDDPPDYIGPDRYLIGGDEFADTYTATGDES